MSLAPSVERLEPEAECVVGSGHVASTADVQLVKERFAMDGTIRGGDVIICRVNGTSDFYVVGTVVSGCVGELSLCGVSTTVGQDAALDRGYSDRLHEQRVWLFDGAASAYVKTSSPPPKACRPAE